MSLLTKSEGFTQPLYGILSGVIWVLSYVLTQLPMGVVYAVWDGHRADLHHWLGSSSATAPSLVSTGIADSGSLGAVCFFPTIDFGLRDIP